MADVLVCASSIHGHVAPMLEIAAHLSGAGHTVRMTTGTRFGDQVLRAGVEFVPLRGASDIDDTNLDTAFPGRSETTGIGKVRFDVSRLFIDPIRSQWDVLTEELRRRPADVVLYETTFMGIAPLLASPAPRPPVIGCGVIPLTLSSPTVPPFGAGLPYAEGRAARFRNRVVREGIRHLVLGGAQRELRTAVTDCVPEARLSGYFMDGAARVECFLQLSVPTLDYPRPDLPPNISYIGPVLPRHSAHAPLPEWWSELDDAKPVVLVTQGTLDVLDLDRLIGPALRGLSTDDVQVVAVTGGRPVERLGLLPANVLAATFLPFELLMPRVSVMVTNGGFGGVHHALAHDVPLVVAGSTEEKPEIAARVAWSGAGINLRTGTPTATQVRDAVRSVLADDAYRTRARVVGDDIRRSDALGTIATTVSERLARSRPKVE